MDNTLFDFVAAKQHACREVAKFLGRDDWEALFNCFVNSPHGFESHENLRDYFDLCGLLETASSQSKIESTGDLLEPLTRFSKAESPFGILEDCASPKNSDAEGERRDNSASTCAISSEGGSPRQASDAPGKGRIDLPCGVPFTREVQSTEASSKAVKVRDNLLADRSLYCNEVFARCCEIYEGEKVRVLEPYPGTRETLGELKRRGFPLAVLTDAHNGNALARLRKTDLFQYFDHVISYDMTGAKKPAPDAFLLALRKLGTSPSETVLVGDSIRRDIAPAKELGMITVYAAYGDRNIRSRDPPDCQPDIVLNDIRELVGRV
jgi:HAD superfamily hydrolase (TIGR01509 family)